VLLAGAGMAALLADRGMSLQGGKKCRGSEGNESNVVKTKIHYFKNVHQEGIIWDFTGSPNDGRRGEQNK